MIIFTNMIFRPSVFARLAPTLALVFGLGGIVVAIVIINNYVVALTISVALTIIVLQFAFFTVLFTVSLMAVKSVERKPDEWIFTYKYRKRIIHINQNNVEKIEINRGASFNKKRFGEMIKIKTKQGKRIILSALHVEQFLEMSDLLAQDFENMVTIVKNPFQK
jgi:hypothetical protein